MKPQSPLEENNQDAALGKDVEKAPFPDALEGSCFPILWTGAFAFRSQFFADFSASADVARA